MSHPTKGAVVGGVVTLAVLGFVTVLGEPLAAWLSPPEIAVPASGSSSHTDPGGAASAFDGGSTSGRDG